MQSRKLPTIAGIKFTGRPRTARRQTWNKSILNGNVWVDITPNPGKTYTRDTWPPRGRGRGESLISPRRIEAKLRACEVMQLRSEGHTWASIARATGFKDASGPYRAMKRAIDRVDWDNDRRYQLFKEQYGLSDEDIQMLQEMNLEEDRPPTTDHFRKHKAGNAGY